MSLGKGGATRFDVRQSNNSEGATVSFIKEGRRYSNLTDAQAESVVKVEGKGPDVEIEAALVKAQVGREGTGTVYIGETGVSEARAGKFSLKETRQNIAEARNQKDLRERKVEDAVADGVNTLLGGEAGAGLALLRSEVGKEGGEGKNQEFIDDVVVSFQRSGMTPQEKGAAARQMVAEAKSLENKVDARLKVAEKELKDAVTPEATAVAKTKVEKLKAAKEKAIEQRKLAETLKREVDRRGCSVCFVNFKNPRQLADAAEEGFRSLIGDTGFKGSDLVASDLVVDRLEIAALPLRQTPTWKFQFVAARRKTQRPHQNTQPKHTRNGTHRHQKASKN